jgi:SAM-dependent methyltransferase
MSPGELSDHARANQEAWNKEATNYVEDAHQKWASGDPCWGIWGEPEANVGIVPDVDGLDVVELGCGTAYWSAWFARRGARPVGVDLSERQLDTAHEMQAEHGLDFPLMHESAEKVPLPDASFDLAFSEYGASLWCDPYVWIPEAARLLRPGGRLLFLTTGILSLLCSPDAEEAPVGERLLRDLFGLHRVEWEDDDSISFQLPHGQWIKLLRDTGFEIEALHELQISEDVPPTRYTWMPREWARRWPCEEIWLARKSVQKVDNPAP